MCITFYNGSGIVGSFMYAMENMKKNHIATFHISASAFVKPEYLQDAPVNFISEERGLGIPSQKTLQFCVDEDKFDTIPVVDVHNAPDITAVCGKLFLNDPEHIKKTVVGCFNERVREGYNPNFEKAAMNVCYSLLEMPLWWFFITTYLQFNYSSPDDVIIYTYQCCEHIKTISTIRDFLEPILFNDESNGFTNMVDNLAFNDMNNVYYENGLEKERKVIDREGIKLNDTANYWWETSCSIDFIINELKRGSVIEDE